MAHIAITTTLLRVELWLTPSRSLTSNPPVGTHGSSSQTKGFLVSSSYSSYETDLFP